MEESRGGALLRGGAAGWEDEDVDDVAAPPTWLSIFQLIALLKRQWLFKKRAWSQTLGEFLSPTLLMARIYKI